MIKALIFDCFGVLATDGWLPFKNQHFSHDPKLLHAASDLNRQADAGAISYVDFIDALAKLADMTSRQVGAAINNNVPNEPLFKLIAKFKDKYKIGLLSNAAANWLDVLFTPEQVTLFDVIALSFETGFLKPQPKAYENIAQKLGVSTNEAVLIDDQEMYVRGAQEAGLQAIYYQSFEQMSEELKKLLTLTDTKS